MFKVATPSYKQVQMSFLPITTISDKFSLSTSVGGNYSYANSTSLEATAGDLSTPALFTLANAAPGTLSITGGANAPYNITQGFSAYGLATVRI